MNRLNKCLVSLVLLAFLGGTNLAFAADNDNDHRGPGGVHHSQQHKNNHDKHRHDRRDHRDNNGRYYRDDGHGHREYRGDDGRYNSDRNNGNPGSSADIHLQ